MMEIWSQFAFLRPLWLLAILPVVGVWFVLRRSQDPSDRYTNLVAPHLLKHMVVRPENRNFIRPTNVLLIECILLVIALAGPSWRAEPSPFAQEEAGLMIVLKVSPTMKAEDLLPSRLERCRLKLHDLFQLRTGGTAGLIAYSGSPHLVMPLTMDTNIIEQMVESLDSSVMPTQGDVLGQALALANNQFKTSKTSGSILIITDGIDASQISSLTDYRKTNGLPVQILAAVAGPDTAVQAGINRGAKSLGTQMQLITVDDSDIRRINARAKSMVSEVAAEREDVRRRDEGYAMLPVITLGVLLWARRGWSINWR